jgi:hypothetical protein
LLQALSARAAAAAQSTKCFMGRKLLSGRVFARSAGRIEAAAGGGRAHLVPPNSRRVKDIARPDGCRASRRQQLDRRAVRP